MKIVVIGGTGLIGSKTVAILRQGGNEVVAASPQGGVNTVTGEGLKEAIAGAQVVIDLSNAPSRDAKAVLEFFETSGRNLLAAEAAAGVQHHVALSIVGTDRVPDQGYYRAKVAQEKLIEASSIPYTIIRSTQFLEFLGGIADASADGGVVRVPPGLIQPIAADDVAAVVTEVALANPRNGIIEIAGPERAPFNEIVARYLKAVGDPREVVKRPRSPIFRRATRGQVARTIGRGSSRPPQSRGVATPLAERSLIRPSGRRRPRPGRNNEERRPTYMQREEAHEDPNHHRRHLRRPSLLDGRRRLRP